MARPRRDLSALPFVERSYALIDLERNTSGDGRTVTAYAATFGDPYEVRDQFGHYFETINRSAFNRAIGLGLDQLQVLFNHGRDLQGNSSDRFSMPLGRTESVRADARGLLTVTRYSKTPLADEVLQLIADGAIRAQSFRGPILRNGPQSRHDSGLPLVERTELGLVEYGPAPFPVNTGAAMVGVRSNLLTVDPAELTDEERLELLALLDAPPAATGEPAIHDGTSTGGPDPDADTPPAPVEPAPQAGQSLDLLKLRNAQRQRRA